MVFVKECADSEEEAIDIKKKGRVRLSKQNLPQEIKPDGLDSKRQNYLFQKIREFCTAETRDVTCPKPSVLVEPESDPEPEPESEPEPKRARKTRKSSKK